MIERLENLDNSLRVYFLDDIPTPYRIGVLHEFVSKFNGRLRVGFCASEEPGRKWDIDLSNLDCEILPGFSWRPPKQKTPFSFKMNFCVVKSLQKFKPDVVVLSGYTHPTIQLAAEWCRRNDVPFGITCETNLLNTTSKGLRWLLKKIIVHRIVSKMSFGLPTGKLSEKYLRILGAKSQPMYYFPNTPDIRPIFNITNKMKDAQSREVFLQKVGLPQNKKIILYAGRLIDAKRPLDLAIAYSLISAEIKENTVAVFVGDGPLLPKLKEYKLRYDDIFTLGWISDPDIVYSLMAIADIFVLPSSHEPWGAVINEAMAAGSIVVSSDQVGAANELIEDGINGYLFPVGDIAQLQNILENIIVKEKESCELIEKKARDTAVKYGHSFAVNNLLSALQKISLTP